MKWRSLFLRKPVERLLQPSEKLHRNLRILDLTALGIGAIVGAGIFATIGEAASKGGPAVVFLFIFTAIACGFSALSYAEFASGIPIAGSAYTYAYAAFGELIAWIIGWDLLLEYAIGNIAVAISWSDYFTSLLSGLGIEIPPYLTMDTRTAYEGYQKVHQALLENKSLSEFPLALQEAYKAWMKAPRIVGDLRFIIDVPAFLIVVIITTITYIGIRESKWTNNLLVAFKLLILLLFIVVGSFYVQPQHWTPFMPNGLEGVMQGVAAVFFAYIGFDALSTTAEECKNPQKDLPKAMVLSLLITTIIYVLIALVLTGLVDYRHLNVGDPLAYALKVIGLDWFSGIVALSALVAMTGVLLVFAIGQPRIWMSMSRDGLLPPIFAVIHPVYRTPSFATIVTGLLTAIPVLFFNFSEVVELTSIGTLFAFLIVNIGVLIMELKPGTYQPKFKVPFILARWWLLLIFVLSIVITYYLLSNWTLSVWIFFILFFILVVLSFIFRLSLLPCLGILTCLYLMVHLTWQNWIRFLLWLLIGLSIYFLYGYKHSKLRQQWK